MCEDRFTLNGSLRASAFLKYPIIIKRIAVIMLRGYSQSVKLCERMNASGFKAADLHLTARTQLNRISVARASGVRKLSKFLPPGALPPLVL